MRLLLVFTILLLSACTYGCASGALREKPDGTCEMAYSSFMKDVSGLGLQACHGSATVDRSKVDSEAVGAIGSAAVGVATRVAVGGVLEDAVPAAGQLLAK